MKPEINKILPFVFLIFAYSLQAIVSFHPFPYIYFLGFIASVVFLYIIKNKYLGFSIGAIILFLMEIYNKNYIFLTFLPFLFICAHKNLVSDATSNKKNKKHLNGLSLLCTQFSVLLTITFFIYDFFLFAKDNLYPNSATFKNTIFISVWLIGLLVYSFFQNKKKCVNRFISENLTFIYLVSIFSFLSTVLFCQVHITDVSIVSNAIYFPWFVFICSMVYNDDPYILSIAKSIDNLLTAISNKDKVK